MPYTYVINEAIKRSRSCITTLVHGDYGTGKTSFMRSLRQKLEEVSEKSRNPNSTSFCLEPLEGRVVLC